MVNAIIYFFIYSAMGFLIETVYTFIHDGYYSVRRSMLHSPMCIVYGVGAEVLILTSVGRWESVVAVFALGAAVCSAAEYGVSLWYEKVCGVLLWDYSHRRGNINGRICPVYSLYWGFISVVFCRYVHPAMEFIVERADSGLLLGTAIILIMYFRRDMKITMRELKKCGSGEKSMCDDTLQYVMRAPKRKIY